MDPEQERAVALGLREGRAEAWRTMYDAHAEPLWRWVARRLSGRSADVADVVQETFLAAARNAAQFDSARGSTWLWLAGIARNQVALYYRKQERHQSAAHVECIRFAGDGRLQRWLDGHEDNPAESLESAELASLVRLVLSKLTTDYEVLLTARYLDGDSVEDLARQEGVTITALRSRLARARQAFREALAGMSDQILDAVSRAKFK